VPAAEEIVEEDPPRRFDVALFVVHPSMTPADITKALGLEAYFTSCRRPEKDTQRKRLCPVDFITPDGDTASDMKRETSGSPIKLQCWSIASCHTKEFLRRVARRAARQW
jgi:hypothetical protein